MQPIQAHAKLTRHVFPIQALINLICDVKTMEDAVMEMKYDSEKAPLGTMYCIKCGKDTLLCCPCCSFGVVI